jgi:hypothetical protein
MGRFDNRTVEMNNLGEETTEIVMVDVGTTEARELEHDAVKTSVVVMIEGIMTEEMTDAMTDEMTDEATHGTSDGIGTVDMIDHIGAHVLLANALHHHHLLLSTDPYHPRLPTPKTIMRTTTKTRISTRGNPTLSPRACSRRIRRR